LEFSHIFKDFLIFLKKKNHYRKKDYITFGLQSIPNFFLKMLK